MSTPASASPERQVARQGWIQTLLIIVSTVSAVTLAYGRVENEAGRATETAIEARKDAEQAKDQIQALQVELLKFQATVVGDVREIKAILEARLPAPKGN